MRKKVARERNDGSVHHFDEKTFLYGAWGGEKKVKIGFKVLSHQARRG